MIEIKKINIDIETYSDEDLRKVGVYKYADSPNFEILLFAYSVDDSEETCIDLTIDEIPEEVLSALIDKNVLKIAFNAQFERVCLSHYLASFSPFSWLDPAQWHCTMVHANELGLPASLGQCAKYLNIEEQKDTRGTQLINYFSKPCKPTKANNLRTRNLPEHAPDKWQTFIDYCIQDVKTEKAIAKKLSMIPVQESEWVLYTLDQRINDLGVKVDDELAKGAIDLMHELSERNLLKMQEITGLDNPNSLKQLKEWLANHGASFESLGKEIVQQMIEQNLVSGEVKKVLELRLKTSNSSTKKYLVMENAKCEDDRVHGLLQFYGASRTGRWAGRLLQVQNLPRNHMTQLDLARDLVKDRDEEMLEVIFDSVPDVLKQLIRTGLIAKEGHTFYVSDFSAIEARVIAWYAGEKWAIDAFREHGKIYEATASQMFRVPLDKVDGDLRQRGKVATLALGYQGGTGALIQMGALKQGIPEEDLQGLVDAWRKANKNIVKFWYDVQRAAIEVLQNGGVSRMNNGQLKFYKKAGFLFIQLPSGRKLSYAKARLEEGTYGPQTVYEGQGDKVAFQKLHTYGGKLVENIVQATARDLLAEAMLRLDKKGFPIVFHVHDEVVCEVPKNFSSIEEMNEIMSIAPDWAKGLPLAADGYATNYYKKE